MKVRKENLTKWESSQALERTISMKQLNREGTNNFDSCIIPPVSFLEKGQLIETLPSNPEQSHHSLTLLTMKESVGRNIIT